MLKGVIIVFSGLIGSFILAIMVIVIVDMCFWNGIMAYMNLQPGDPFYPAVLPLEVLSSVICFIPPEYGLLGYLAAALRAIKNETEVSVW